MIREAPNSQITISGEKPVYVFSHLVQKTSGTPTGTQVTNRVIMSVIQDADSYDEALGKAVKGISAMRDGFALVDTVCVQLNHTEQTKGSAAPANNSQTPEIDG